MMGEVLMVIAKEKDSRSALQDKNVILERRNIRKCKRILQETLQEWIGDDMEDEVLMVVGKKKASKLVIQGKHVIEGTRIHENTKRYYRKWIGGR